MITKNISTLQIHTLSKEQYERELAAGRIDENAIYLTPEEEVDFTGYATEEFVQSQIAAIPPVDISGKADKTYVDSKFTTLVGDTSVATQIATAVDDLRATITTVVMSAATWDASAKTYSFESTYPAATHNLELELNGDVATEAQFEAFNAAMMVASANTNVVKAFGEVPTIDIPVILKVQVK